MPVVCAHCSNWEAWLPDREYWHDWSPAAFHRPRDCNPDHPMIFKCIIMLSMSVSPSMLLSTSLPSEFLKSPFFARTSLLFFMLYLSSYYDRSSLGLDRNTKGLWRNGGIVAIFFTSCCHSHLWFKSYPHMVYLAHTEQYRQMSTLYSLVAHKSTLCNLLPTPHPSHRVLTRVKCTWMLTFSRYYCLISYSMPLIMFTQEKPVRIGKSWSPWHLYSHLFVPPEWHTRTYWGEDETKE